MTSFKEWLNESKLESVVGIVSNSDSETQNFNIRDVGLKKASDKKTWIKAIEKNGYSGYGKAWSFDKDSFK